MSNDSRPSATPKVHGNETEINASPTDTELAQRLIAYEVAAGKTSDPWNSRPIASVKRCADPFCALTGVDGFACSFLAPWRWEGGSAYSQRAAGGADGSLQD